MADALLQRFDLQVLRDKAPGDAAQVPLPAAQVDFYLQGATVHASQVVGPNGIAEVLLHDVGEITQFDRVEAGVGGPILEVYDDPVVHPFPSPSTVFLRNLAPQPVTLAVGTRLINTSRRPPVFADPVAGTPVGSSLVADASGRVSGYVALQRFDYVVRPIAVLKTSTAPLVEGPGVSWPHEGHPLQNAVVVGISWTKVGTGDPIASVKYGGMDMTLVGGTTGAELWHLVTPPAGTQMVEVLFSPGGSTVNAIAGASSLSNTDGAAMTGTIASSTSMQPAVTVVTTSAKSLVVSVLGIVNLSAPLGVYVMRGPLAPLWDASVGAAPKIVRGVGAERRGRAGDSICNWQIGPAATWGVVGAEVKAAANMPSPWLVIDAIGGTQPSPSWRNIRDFASLADAIASLPAAGGTVFIPTGRYRVGDTVTIEKPRVTLLGEGPGSMLEAADPTKDLLRLAPGGDHCRLVNLTLDGKATAANAGSVLVVAGTSTPDPEEVVSDILLDNIVIRGAANYGLVLRGLRRFLAMGCEISGGKSHGVSVDGTAVGTEVQAARFVACRFLANAQCGADVIGNVASLSFDLCSIEGNGGTGEASGIRVRLAGSSATRQALVALSRCRFQHSLATTSPAFISLANAPATLVDECSFEAGGKVARGVIVRAGAEGTRVSNCSGAGFSTEVGQEAALVEFQVEGVQFGNRECDLVGTRARVVASGSAGLFFGVDPVATTLLPAGTTLAGARLLPAYSTSSRPSASTVPPGTAIWVDGMKIQVSTGTAWKEVPLTPAP